MGNRITGSRILYTVWLIIFFVVAIITLNYELESTSFQGIAETQEIVVNSENPVEIKRINVVEGQSVSKGRQLVELSSPELTIKINEISHQLEQIRAQKGINKAEIKSKIDQLEAEKAARISEINNQIRQLENQYNINRALTSGLKSIRENENIEKTRTGNPIILKIESLKQDLALSISPVNIQIDLLKKALDTSESPLKIQVEQLEKELALLKIGNRKLNIYSQISGIIGSVNFKPGEKVAPFAPILTLHTKTPSFIKGYIYENVYTHISTGQKVTVASITDTRSSITGTVVGVGARIVEYPIRLRKHPDLQSWGREVVIKIPEKNSFILGEKVLISAADQEKTFIKRISNLFPPKESRAETSLIQPEKASEGIPKKRYALVPVVPLKTGSIEISGILYLSDIDRYLVVSDETPDKKPLLFLMNIEGKITKEIRISGLKKIDDMESITVGDDGIIYIASSLNPDKKGKTKKSRRLLISVKRNGDKFNLVHKIDLLSVLEKSAYRDRTADWAQFLLNGMVENTIDMEGMFYNNGSLFLGFKSPLLSGQSVFLKIENVTALFNGEEIDKNRISIWKTLQLATDHSPDRERISDLFYQSGTLYITGAMNSKTAEKKAGSLWRFNEKSGETTRIFRFEGFQPEAIAEGRDKGTLMIGFDQGNHSPSQIAIVKVEK